MLDFDNLVASMKPIVDAMRDAGWLVDDSPAWLLYEMPHQVRGEQRQVVVEVEDVP